MDFPTFFNQLLKTGLETFRKYYGPYRGLVTRNDDPEERGRIQAYVARAHGPTPTSAPDVWVMPNFAAASNDQGAFFPPPVGAVVWVEFENGDPSKPIRYGGGFYGKDETPTEFRYSPDGTPRRQGIITRGGHALLFNDEPGSERVGLFWHKASSQPATPDQAADRTTGDNAFYAVEPDGSLSMLAKNGMAVSLSVTDDTVMVVHPNGCRISLDTAGVQIADKGGNLIALSGGTVQVMAQEKIKMFGKITQILSAGVVLGLGVATYSLVKGELMLAQHAAHTHLSAVGATTPPVSPMTPDVLSKVSKTV